MIGRKLSNFHINERIGEGGMGTVYKATDLSLNRTVAIKMLHPFLVNNPDSFKRFRNEAHLSARISHPNVATLFDFQEAEGSHFIVMEYVQGKALDDVLKLQDKLPEEEAVKVTLMVLEGLGAAHELGIMHRDLKPGNIMVTHRGFVKLMDFGIARLENTERMTRQNSVIGTLEYLAPELVKGAAPSKASDLYAVGVMLYEMVSGETLFSEDSEAALMYQIAHKQPSFRFAGFSKNLIRVIKKLTNKQVSKRYQSTQEVIQDLEKISRGGKINTRLLSQKVAAPAKLAKPSISIPFNLSKPNLAQVKKVNLPFDMDLRIIAGAAVLCLMILIFGINRSGESPTPSGEEGNGEIAENRQDIERADAEMNTGGLLANNLPNKEAGRKEITFIERFTDDESPSPEEADKQRQTQRSESRTEKSQPKEEKRKQVVQEEKKQTTYQAPEKQAPEKKESIQPETKSELIQEREKPEEKVEEKIVERPREPEPEPERRATRSVKLRIPDTYIAASFSEGVSTEKNYEGQTVYLRTSSPLYKGEHLIIAKGATVKAVVKKLRKSEGKKKAFLALNLVSVQAINGRWLSISYPEYSNLSKTVVEFQRGLQLNKIKLKSTNITINY